MKPLFRHWNDIIRRFKKTEHHLYLFDFDGTLTAIQDTPEDVLLDPGIRETLRRLSEAPRCYAGIVSGRPIEQLRTQARLNRLIYVGNHGLEIQNNGWGFVHPGAQARSPALNRLGAALAEDLQGIPGARVEDKRLSLSIHYRLVLPEHVPSVRQIVRKHLRSTPDARTFRLCLGKKVFEIRPVGHWDKGSAVLWLKRFMPPKTLIFYVGDDMSDEDAFRILQGSGITVCVGARRSSLAQYYIRSQADVRLLFKRLTTLEGIQCHV